MAPATNICNNLKITYHKVKMLCCICYVSVISLLNQTVYYITEVKTSWASPKKHSQQEISQALHELEMRRICIDIRMLSYLSDETRHVLEVELTI